MTNNCNTKQIETEHRQREQEKLKQKERKNKIGKRNTEQSQERHFDERIF